MYQNHLKGLVQHRKLDHIPKVFDSVGLGFPDGSVVKKKKKNPPAKAGDAGSVPETGRFPGVGNGNPFQYSCLENPMDRGAWRATGHGVTESDMTSSHTCTVLGWEASLCISNLLVWGYTFEYPCFVGKKSCELTASTNSSLLDLGLSVLVPV